MVIKQVKHWMKLRASAAALKPITAWASARGAAFELTDEGEGFQITDSKHELGAMRVEWGAPQRDYIQGAELRIRWELQLASELQMMVIERELQDRLERAVYEAYTDTLQTRMDTDTPEEMRWLVMLGKTEQWRSKVARSRFTACAVSPELAAAWVGGALGEALAVASQQAVPAGHPFVLMTQRGRLYLRTRMDEVQLSMLKGFVSVAEIAAREARRLQQRVDALDDSTQPPAV
jgi:hypothetical protein